MGQNETDLEFAVAASVSGQRGRIFMSFPNDSAAAATNSILSHLVCLPGKGGTLGRYQQSRGDTRMCPTLIFCEFLWIWTWTARFHLTSLCWSSCQTASDYTRWFISILSSIRSSIRHDALLEILLREGVKKKLLKSGQADCLGGESPPPAWPLLFCENFVLYKMAK